MSSKIIVIIFKSIPRGHVCARKRMPLMKKFFENQNIDEIVA